MNVIERALELRGQAIAILLAERGRIDEHLAQLGHGQMPGKKRGRPAKLPQTPETPDAK